MSKSVIIQCNSNFHRVSGEDILDKQDARFKEYRLKWKQWPEQFLCGDFPLFIDIEVTSACNLACPFCASTFRGKKIEKGFISTDVVRKIIDEGTDNGLYGVKFNIRGEPLLHPNISEYVAYAKKRGLIDVYFNTNGMLLTAEVSKKLIDAGLDRITLSAEGCTAELYEKKRVGARFDVVVANIEALQALKNKMGVSHPKIRVQTVMLPEIKPILEEYKRFWGNRADEIAFLDFKEMAHKKRGVVYPWACPQLWQRMAVWWDGTVLPCNHDDDGLLALGNAKHDFVKVMWNSPAMKQLRDGHRNGMAHTFAACNGCYLRDSEIEKIKQRI